VREREGKRNRNGHTTKKDDGRRWKKIEEDGRRWKKMEEDGRRWKKIEEYDGRRYRYEASRSGGQACERN
jgi:hypothetical protein